MKKRPLQFAKFAIPLLYALFGVIWILLTDSVLLQTTTDLEQITRWQIWKGWIFVGISSLFIYLLLAEFSRREKKQRSSLAESESRFRHLAENAAELIYRYEFVPEPRFTYVSPAAMTITGYTPEEHYADPELGFKLVLPEDRHLVEQAAAETDGTPLLMRWRRKDGRIIWTEQTNVLVYDEQGNRVAMQGIARDVTEKMDAQQALAESEQRFREAVVAAPLPMMLHAEDGEVLTVNDAWVEITGYTREQMQMMPGWLQLAYGDQWKAVHKKIQTRYYDKERVHAGEFTIRIADDSQRIWDFSSMPMGALPDGRRTAISIAVDVTERKQVENAYRETSEELESYFANTLDLLCITDLEGRFLRINQEWEQALGYSLSELEGRRFINFVHPDDHEETMAKMVQLLGGQGVTNFVNRYRHQDGSYIWLEWRSRPSDERFYAAARDITRRIEIEGEIRSQTAQLTQVINSVPAGVLLLNSNQELLIANEEAYSLLEFLGRIDEKSLLLQLGDLSLSELLDMMELQQSFELTYKKRLIEIVARPVAAGPLPQGWVLVLRDITKERLVQEQLERQERLAAIGQLAAGIAHDFNNVMGVIILYSQLLEIELAQMPRARGRMQTIVKQAEHASRLIQQILDFSRHAVLEKQPFDLFPFVQAIVELLKRTLPENIDIQLDHSANQFMIMADQTRMEQVLMNLALNARDAMMDGGVLELRLDKFQLTADDTPPLVGQEPGNWIMLQVSDTGSGISKDDLNHIFEPFFTTKKREDGTGLGLAQVHGIIGQHGGHISVSSTVGQGTTFSIYLPQLSAEKMKNRVLLSELKTPGGDGEQILIIEDQIELREALVDTLRSWNYRVTAAAHGQEALDILDVSGVHSFALILSDIVMPVLSGERLLEAFLERGVTAPIVLLTGHPLKLSIEKLHDFHVAAMLSKPVSMKKLRRTIAAALGKPVS